MKWLFGQVWLYCLIAFLLGVLLTWLVMRLLRRPHVEVTEQRTASPAAGNGAARAAQAARLADRSAPTAPEPATVATASVDDVALDDAAPTGADSTPAETAPEPTPAETDEEPTAVAADPDTDTDADADADAGPYGPGSALPGDHGAAPSDEYTVKGNADSMLFHTIASPYYGRTIAEVWFRTSDDARRAGFTAWNERSKAPARAATWEPGPYPGSALPSADGSSPADEFRIKGNADSMLFHTTASPYYTRTKAEVWFRTAEEAEQAGFTGWDRPRERR